MQVSRNCTLDEFVTAGIEVSDEILANIKHVASEVVAPMRSHFEDLKIEKGYDPNDSKFATGLTVTVSATTANAHDLGKYIQDKIVFTECLIDNQTDKVTIGFDPAGRKHNKRIFKTNTNSNGSWIIVDGLQK